MDVGGLFKWLNSPYCEENFYTKLSHENKNEIMDEMMCSELFLDTAKLLVSDESIIRAKLITKLEQLLKKQSSSENKEDNNGQRSVASQLLTNKVASLPDEFGKHIGQGIYLQREGHVIKMTTPGFTVYY